MSTPSACPKALGDTWLFRVAIVAKPRVDEETVRLFDWPEQKIRIVRMHQTLPRPDEEWTREQVDALPTIARLAKEKKLSLCTYPALEFENLGGPYPAIGYVNLLGGVPWHDVQAAVERCKLQQTELGVYIKKQTAIAFYKTLLAMKPEMLESHPDALRRLTEFEQRNLRDLARFKELCKGATRDALSRCLPSLDR